MLNIKWQASCLFWVIKHFCIIRLTAKLPYNCWNRYSFPIRKVRLHSSLVHRKPGIAEAVSGGHCCSDYRQSSWDVREEEVYFSYFQCNCTLQQNQYQEYLGSTDFDPKDGWIYKTFLTKKEGAKRWQILILVSILAYQRFVHLIKSHNTRHIEITLIKKNYVEGYNISHDKDLNLFAGTTCIFLAFVLFL